MHNQNPAPSVSLLVVVPVYNHAASLGSVLAALGPLGRPILVVDDGSEDGIDAVLAQFPNLLPPLRHKMNRGKGAALALAMRYAAAHRYSHMLTFDADGQHQAIDVAPLAARAAENPRAIIIGARDFDSPASGDVPGSSRFGRSFSNFWIWLEGGSWLSDTQSGLRVYPVDLELLESVKGGRYAFEIEILTRALWQGRRILCEPVHVYYPPRAERVSHFRAGADNLRLSLTHMRLCILRCARLVVPFRRHAPREMRGAGLSAWVVAHLGARFAYGLMIFPIATGFLLRAPERSGIVGFYRRLEPGLSTPRYWRLALRNYWYFAASIVDRMRVDGGGMIESGPVAELPPRGSILIGAHFGDWFLVARRAHELDDAVLGLVVDTQQTPVFFKALEARFSGRLRLLDVNEDKMSFVLNAKEILDSGGRICFLVDRIPAPDSHAAAAAMSLDFLGGKSDWLRAPFAIGSRLGRPLHFVCALKKGWRANDAYVVHSRQIWDGTRRISELELAARSLALLEDRVRSAPQHWFNFRSL